MFGVEIGAFAPNNEVTRAQFIQMLMSALELINDQNTSTFSDAKAGEWYYHSITTAQQMGIVNGKTDGAFGINDAISRQDMAAMLYHAALKARANLPIATSTAAFADHTEISDYAANPIAELQQAGIVNGMPDGKFSPKLTATRAEAAVMIYRLFNLLP